MAAEVLNMSIPVTVALLAYTSVFEKRVFKTRDSGVFPKHADNATD